MRYCRWTVIVALALAVGAGACSSDKDSSSSTTRRPSDGIDDPASEAKTAAVAFFEAQAALDYDAALKRSSGAAAVGVEWARAVNGVSEVLGTPFEVRSAPSPRTTVAIERVTATDGGRYTATGYLQIDQRPDVLAAGPVPPPVPGGPTGWFVTDLVFSRRGNRLLVDDYRMDDSPYPVSQLFARFPSDAARVVTSSNQQIGDDATAVAKTIQARLGHHDIDQTVQYYLTAGPTELELRDARFIAGSEETTSEGDPMRLLQDRPRTDQSSPTTTIGTRSGAADHRLLAVREGTFPGTVGRVRLTYVRGDQVATIDVPVPALPTPVGQPVNQVRALLTPATTTSTSTTTTSTTPPTSLVPVPVPVPAPTTASSTTTTSTTSTTTTNTTTTTP